MAPTRTCVGCRAVAPKASLLRMVRAPGGSLSLDLTGSAPGRGCYVHRDLGCVDAAWRRGGVVRALRLGGDADELGRLREETERQMGAT